MRSISNIRQSEVKSAGSRLMGLLFIIFILFVATSEISAQRINRRGPAPPLRQRLFFGGSFALQIGTYSYVEASPVAGLWVLPRLGVAAGPTFKYMSDIIGKTDVWGGKTYARFMVVNDFNNFIPIGLNIGLYLQVEYEALSFRSDWLTTVPETPRTMVQTTFAGFGFSQGVGRRSSVDVTILWTVSDSGYDIYSNPEFRFGFTF